MDANTWTLISGFAALLVALTALFTWQGRALRSEYKQGVAELKSFVTESIAPVRAELAEVKAMLSAHLHIEHND